MAKMKLIKNLEKAHKIYVPISWFSILKQILEF